MTSVDSSLIASKMRYFLRASIFLSFHAEMNYFKFLFLVSFHGGIFQSKYIMQWPYTNSIYHPLLSLVWNRISTENAMWFENFYFSIEWSIRCDIIGNIHIMRIIMGDYEIRWIRFLCNLTFGDDIILAKQLRTTWLQYNLIAIDFKLRHSMA